LKSLTTEEKNMKSGLTAAGIVLLLFLGVSYASFAGTAADGDGDGVYNVLDNCVTDPNAAPLDCDTDDDGYGNYCDADYDQNSAVGVSDFGLFSMQFGMSGAPGFVVQDMDCNGAVGVSDFGRFSMGFAAMAPGPSGLHCAGMVPCDL
jgi:hypothetical protein